MTENWYRFSYLLNPAGVLGRWDAPRGRENGAQIPETPFAEPISAGKGGRAYTAHSYPTKVPPEAIEPYICYYTQPGDVVLDPFCGSGMTGLAARRTGRRAVLNDLSSLAMHLAFNHTEPCDPVGLRQAWEAVRARLEAEAQSIYGVSCGECTGTGRVRYTIWSDVYDCPACGVEVPLWKHGLDRKRGTVKRRLTCPACHHTWQKTAGLRTRSEPAWAAYTCSCSRALQERDLSQEERRRCMAFTPSLEDLFWPETDVGTDREMYKRSALHLQGIRSVADFYTARNLYALALLWNAIQEESNQRVRLALAFAFTNTAWHGTRMRRFNARGGHRPLTGTLYVPQLSSEANVFEVFNHKIRQLERFYAEMEQLRAGTNDVALHRGSATNLEWLEDSSIDYIFTDPPFGSNIFYADCNLIAEAWLGAVTDTTLEAVVNRSRTAKQGGKMLEDYRQLLEQAFAEMHRVLKPGHWATVVFQSSEGEVWQAIESAAAGAGFEIREANLLDKVQQSMKGYKGQNGSENVTSFDIVLNLQKPTELRPNGQRSLDRWELESRVLAAIEEHLERLNTEDDRERSLPFLYSHTVRSLLNAGCSVSGLTMERLRGVLSEVLEERDGRWFLPASESTVR